MGRWRRLFFRGGLRGGRRIERKWEGEGIVKGEGRGRGVCGCGCTRMFGLGDLWAVGIMSNLHDGAETPGIP